MTDGATDGGPPGDGDAGGRGSGGGDAGARSQRVVLRPASALWTFWLLAAFVLWLLGDAVLRGAWEFALSALPWLLLVLWVVYVVLLRPCVALGPEGITIVNVFRRHLIPWSLVDDFTTRFSLLVRLTDGRAIRSWGAPSTGIDRPFQTGSSLARFAAPEQPRAAGVRRPDPSRTGRARRAGEPTIGSIIESARDRWDATGEPGSPAAARPGAEPGKREPVSRWEWWSVAVTVALAAVCAATLAR